jgi:preprotein translocase subunit SecA
MNQTQIAKIQRFMDDHAMSDSVHAHLQQAFLKRKEGEDVMMKAARFVALNLLDDAWRELGNIARMDAQDTPPRSQVGL